MAESRRRSTETSLRHHRVDLLSIAFMNQFDGTVHSLGGENPIFSFRPYSFGFPI